MIACLSVRLSVFFASAMDSQDRARANPCVGVSDLQKCLKSYFVMCGNRDLGALLHVVEINGVTWKTAPKACWATTDYEQCCLHEIQFNTFWSFWLKYVLKFLIKQLFLVFNRIPCILTGVFHCYMCLSLSCVFLSVQKHKIYTYISISCLIARLHFSFRAPWFQIDV